jgi:ubiquinone/menaquinone biosynthesis C-methylase UbiE
MAFDYESSTKHAYKDRTVADEYHAAFTEAVTWKTFRAHFIAKREQRIIREFLDRAQPKKALDIPCGTGKLAPVFAGRQCSVVAADISPDMLEIARVGYGRELGDRATFELCDIEQVAHRFAAAGLDTVVCLRLMHRVPADVRGRALDAIARVAPRAIVSFGISSAYHRARKKIRNMVFREPDRPLCQETMEGIRQELARNFEVVDLRHVSPVLSEEVVFLLQSRH